MGQSAMGDGREGITVKMMAKLRIKTHLKNGVEQILYK